MELSSMAFFLRDPAEKGPEWILPVTKNPKESAKKMKIGLDNGNIVCYT